jgi:hypothetical protein
MITRFIQIIDGFYPKPDLVRRRALAMSYSEPEGVVGWRTECYQPKGIKQLIEKRFKIRIGYWEEDLTATEACNGVFFSAFSRGPRAEKVGIHYDEPPAWAMLLVYLRPGARYDAGTSLWQHRKTGLVSKPTKRDAARLGISRDDLEHVIERDSCHRSRWIEIDRVGNVYNRAVMFPGGYFHSASGHFGSNRHNGRLYQAFHFPLIKQ